MRSDKLELLHLFVALGPSQPYGLWSRDGRLLWARLNAEISSLRVTNTGVSAALCMFDLYVWMRTQRVFLHNWQRCHIPTATICNWMCASSSTPEIQAKAHH